MSRIRRALAIAAVGAASLAAGCGNEGGGGGGEGGAQTACAEQLAGATVEVTYRAKEAPGTSTIGPESFAETVSILCERVEALGREAYVEATEPDRIVIEIADAPDAGNVLEEITAPHELSFYDWEANLVAPDAPRSGEHGFRSRTAAVAALTQSGTIVVEERAGEGPEQTGSEFFLIRDRPALTSEEITIPEQSFDAATGQPTVSFEFTPEGEEAFEAMTRDVVTRAAAEAPPGLSAEQAIEHSGHFAIVHDGEMIARPAINFVENPDGIDGNNGAQIAGGLTLTEAQSIVSFLEIGVLPVELVREP